MGLNGNGGDRLHILCLGLSHRTASLDVRNRVSFSGAQLSVAHSTLRNRVDESIILSTCNRTEVYALSPDTEESAQVISRFLSEFHETDPDLFMPHAYVLPDEQAVRHLFRVASGLDSLILGESQVLGQVRDAVSSSAEAKASGVTLSRLFHYALHTGRRARAETEIGRNALSASYAGVKLAQQLLGSLADKTVLLVGAGEVGRLVAQALRNIGIGNLFIANRTESRGQDLAGGVGGSLLAFDGLGDNLSRIDIVLSSTDAPGTIFGRDTVAKTMEARHGRPLFMFDLAVPRDIDPEVADIPGVHLFNIDDLGAIADENRRGRENAIDAAEAIIEEEVQRFSKWWHSLEAVPLIKVLQDEAESIRLQELEKAFRRLPDLDENERKVLEQVGSSIVKKLLYSSISALRQQSAGYPLRETKELDRPEESMDSRPAKR